jgi:V8-like Glu-specific endopeptidase
MNKQVFTSFIVLSIPVLNSCGLSPTKPSASDLKVVYGRDNRVDITSQTSPVWTKMSQNVALLVQNKELKRSNEVFGLSTKTLQQAESLCENERFSDQPTAGFCTGFLIKDNILITAGHCIKDEATCIDTSFVFDFKKDFVASSSTVILPSSTVYSCKEVLFTETSDEIDVAVIELDRSHLRFEPVSLSSSAATSGDKLTVLGHPNGLPMKLDAGGKVRYSNQDLPHFVADLDTFAGSSGSPVFDTSSKGLTGILVKGERDYEWDAANQCNRVLKCKTSSCRGEEVIRAEMIPDRYRN